MIFEQLVLGFVQGVIEWLPVSSEGIVSVLRLIVFGGQEETTSLIRFALWLHVGTFAAALVYFRKKVRRLLQAALQWRTADKEEKQLVSFLGVATVVSGIVGGGIYLAIAQLSSSLLAGKGIMLLIGAALLVTAAIQWWQPSSADYRQKTAGSVLEAAIVGMAQGLAIIPGVSRSGATVAALLIQGFTETTALRLSFLLSMPAVLGANVVLHASQFTVGVAEMVGFAAAFGAGLVSMHTLLHIAEKVRFTWFTALFGALTIVAALFV